MACTSGCWPASRRHAAERATSPGGLCEKQGGGKGQEAGNIHLQVYLWPLSISRGDLPVDHHPDPVHPQQCTQLSAPPTLQSWQQAQEHRASGPQREADSGSNYTGCYFNMVCLGVNA